MPARASSARRTSARTPPDRASPARESGGGKSPDPGSPGGRSAARSSARESPDRKSPPRSPAAAPINVGRKRLSSRDAFIATTARLLRRQGYAATGLNEIVAASGAPKGSLYFHFPGGKEQLALEAMQRSGGELRAAIAATMASAGGPRESLGILIDALGAGLEASGFRDGCPIATVTLESAASSEPIRLTAERVFESWLGALRDSLRKSGMDAPSAERRALHVLAAVEGGLLIARARRDVAPLHALREELLALF